VDQDRTITVRSISSSTLSENDLIKVINEKIINIKHKDEVRPALNKIIELAKDNPEMKTVNLYANILRPLRVLEGIIWRMRTIVEECGACHLAALNMLKGMYYKRYVMGPHIAAIMDYLVEPNIKQPKFENVSGLQEYTLRYIIPELAHTLKNIRAITESLPEDFVFDFDNYLVMGYDKSKNIRFISDARRYKKVVRGNLYYLIFQKSRALGLMYLSINYDLNKVMTYYKKLIKKTALNNLVNSLPFIKRLPKNNTPKEFLDILSARKFKGLGKARTERFTKAQIQDNLNRSLTYIYNAQVFRVRALEESLRQADIEKSSDYLLRPKLLAVNYDDILQNMKERRDIYHAAKFKNEATYITSKATGMQFRVNPKAFFIFHKDLKHFLPKAKFEDRKRGDWLRDKNGKIRHQVTHKKIHKWDYMYGRPVAWDDPTFAGLFPDATNENFY